MRSQRALPEEAKATIRALPKDADPMDVLRTAISAAGVGLGVSGKPTYEQAVALTARFPTAITMFARQREGAEPTEPRTDLGHAANYLYMLTGQTPEDRHTKSLDTYLVLLADHGMNASTFTARVIASTQAGLASAFLGGLSALKGPLHGGAPGPVIEMLDGIGAPGRARAWIEHALDRGDRLMGFGHRVYKVRDPRADALKRAVRQLAEGSNVLPGRLAFAEAVEEAALAILKDRKPNRSLQTNVEFYTALLLEALRFPPSAFTCAFAMGRSAGWIAHAREQVLGGRLIRPQSRYVGPRPRKAA
jgi:citrate synthase